jgi:protein-tyrosine phosphatase
VKEVDVEPLADLHCHLLAGLDDGPRTLDDAAEMCRTAAAEGVGYTVALAHQSERWPVTPDQIRASAAELAARLAADGVPVEVYPGAEVMAAPNLVDGIADGRLMTVGGHGKHVLVEMPHRLFVDLRPAVRDLRRRGVRVVLAHPERHPEFLHDPGVIDEYIRLGCLVQVSSGSVTDPADPADGRALREWFRRGCVHLLGSDGHSPRRRKPLLAAAARLVREWAGPANAERICGANGLRVLRGEPVAVEPPTALRRWWPVRAWGG